LHENWDYPTRSYSKCFMIINFHPYRSRGAHICFQTNVLYGDEFANGYDIDALRISSYLTFCGQTQHVLSVRVCSTFISHLWARNNPRDIHQRGYRVRFGFSFWAGIVRDIVVGSHLLLDRLTVQQCRGFMETILPGLLEDVHLAVRQRLWFHHYRAPVHYIWHWFNATYPGKWNRS
jgi:hypothetical protein